MLKIATAAKSLATASEVTLQLCMNRHRAHADRAFLPRGQFPKRADILLGAEIELASSFIKLLLDALANLLMLLAVMVLTILVAIPNALAGRALFEGITFLFTPRTQLGRGPVFRGGFFGFIILSFHRFAERHGAELLRNRRCSVVVR